MEIALVSLIGEQPAPNLLPARHLKPELVILVHTERTRRVAENLKALLKPESDVYLCEAPPYDVLGCQESIKTFLSENLPGYDLIFNLTGGTKLMALAAFDLTRRYRAPFVYFQTEGNLSQLHYYEYENEQIQLQKTEELEITITLNDYLQMYLGGYEIGEPCNSFEDMVYETLRAVQNLETMWSVRPQGLGALEIDFVVRYGNQVGVGEVKTKGAKSGIDQINAVADQRYLGTYVRKFLVSGKSVDRNNRNLAEAYRIEVIELPSYQSGFLNEKDKTQLVQTVVTRLGGPSIQKPTSGKRGEGT